MNEPKTSSAVFGALVGMAVAGVLLCAGTVVGYSWVKKKGADARKGWNLVPVVVAAVDIPDGTLVTMEMISQRSVPEQFVTASVVKPDSASYIVNQRVNVPLNAGDPLRWSDFETAKRSKVLFAAKDVTVGVVLSEADVEEREVDPALITESWLTSADRPTALGRKTIAPFRRGDPILWTHLPPNAAR